jgi:glutaredoxin
MKHTIVVFTLNGCKYCYDLKNKLTELEIPFNDIEISINKEIWDSVVKQTGHNVLPTVYINKNNSNEGPIYIPGVDFKNENEIVEIIKTFI